MRERFYLWVTTNASWPRIGLLVASCMVLMGAFAIRENVLILDARCGHGGVPDTRPWYTPGDVATFFNSIGKNGRDLYVATQLTLDFLFPFLYSGLLCGVLGRLWTPVIGRWLIWLPVGAGAADLGENGLLTWLASSFTGQPDNLARVAACFTAAKWGLLTASLLAVLLGFLVWLVRPGCCEASDAAAPPRTAPPAGEAP